MKRQVLNLTLLTALLTPVAMGAEIISDEELDDVSGGQLQVITNGGNVNAHDDNNNGSVILHNNAQRYVSGVYISNNAASAVNNATNIVNALSSGPVTVTQTNNQCADNSVMRKQQEVANGGDVNDIQDNENASVLITDDAQQNANNLSLVNSAVSAVSRATNMVNIPTAGSLTATQTSEQDADNEVAHTDLDYPDPDPHTGIAREGYQYIENGGDINGHQRNDQGSINITDNGQENIENFDVTNVALSASNLGTNILNANVDTTATVTQSNTQNAANRLAFGSAGTNEDYEFRQDVDTAGNINPGAVQENDNLSVALSGNAQRNAQAGILINGAASAINAGSNIANVNASGAVTVSQTNTQDACNWIQTDHPQDVNNGGMFMESSTTTTDPLA